MTGRDYLVGTLIGLAELLVLGTVAALVLHRVLCRADEHNDVLAQAEDEK